MRFQTDKNKNSVRCLENKQWKLPILSCIHPIYLFKIDETMLMTSFHFVAGTPQNQTRKTRLAQYRHSIVSAPQNTSASGTPCHLMQMKKSNNFSCTSVNDSSRLRATSHPNLDPRSELFVAIVLHTPSITPTPVGNTYASSTVNGRLGGHIK